MEKRKHPRQVHMAAHQRELKTKPSPRPVWQRSLLWLQRCKSSKRSIKFETRCSVNTPPRSPRLLLSPSLTRTWFSSSAQVYSAAKGTYEAVRDAETNYRISEKITDGVKSTVASARRMEEDYQLSQKVAEAGTKASEALTAAARRAQELEQQHEIRDRVALALREGWESIRYAGETLSEYEREYQVTERIKDTLYQGYEQASEYCKQSVQYWRQPPPALPYPTLPANSDV
mmetsp:Transcript_41310/g.82715  ORF Transcript_41310/g.82715 Transcript_41310/m.82715 type:complete len:231 (-) Transcript_41310:185-877(-)